MKGCSLLDLPLELQQHILRTVAGRSDKYPTGLLEIAKTCKHLHTELQGAHYWEAAWAANQRSTCAKQQHRLTLFQRECPLGVKARDALRLTCASGCMMCGKARTRKVFWPFLVRACPDCLEAHSIRLQEVTGRFGLRRSHVADLPAIAPGSLSPISGRRKRLPLRQVSSRAQLCLWRPQVDALVRQQFRQRSFSALKQTRARYHAAKMTAARRGADADAKGRTNHKHRDGATLRP